jgi:hypothetical protein
MSNRYLRSFIIGASIPVVFLFYLGVMRSHNKNYSYETYTLVAPIYFGFMNAISLYFSKKYNLTLRQRLLYTSVVSALVVVCLAKLFKTYTFSREEWLVYVMKIIVFHIFTYNVIIYFLEKSV